MKTAREVAQLIDHAALAPTLTDKQLEDECALAAQYHVASVCVKPCHVKRASELLKGTDVRVGTVVSFPHGNSSINVKAFECKQAVEDGAVEVDVVVNIGKVLSEDWGYVEQEIRTLNDICVGKGAVLKVIFENVFLHEKHKIKLCEICTKLKVAFVKTSTGYNWVKGPDGKHDYNNGATIPDLTLMRRHCSPEVGVKAAGGVRDLDAVLRVLEAGASRIGTKDTAVIMKQAIMLFGE